MLLGPAFVMAQNSSPLPRNFSVNTNPANPAPDETVNMSVSAFEFNLDLSHISWSLNGTVKESGTGKKNFSFVNGPSGKTSIVKIVVSPPEGSPVEKIISISSAELDLLWEVTDGYAPPFYKGKILPVKQGQIKMVAIPHIKSGNGFVPRNQLVYKWRKDNKDVTGQSGFGKTSFIFGNQLLDKGNRIEVAVSNGTQVVNADMLMQYLEPDIIFYEEDQLTGPLYQKAILGQASTNKTKLTLVAEPYFLDKNFKTNKSIKFEWKIDNQKVEATKKNSITMNTGGETRTIIVSAYFEDIARLFRDFKGGINVNLTR